MNARRANHHAFTLMELLIVIVVLGVLVGLTLTRYAKTIDCRYQREARDTTNELIKAEQIYRMEHGVFTPQMNELPLVDPNSPDRRVKYTVAVAQNLTTVLARGTYQKNLTTAYLSQRCYEPTQDQSALTEDGWPCPLIRQTPCTTAGSGGGVGGPR